MANVSLITVDITNIIYPCFQCQRSLKSIS